MKELPARDFDYLFRGSHPAFFWAAVVLKQKGKKVAILPSSEGREWECVPHEVLSLLDLHDFKTNRDENPIQIVTTDRRAGIFNDLEFTQRDFEILSATDAKRFHKG